MWLRKRDNLLFLALITALGFCLRIYRLDYPELWYDELCTFSRVNGDMAHTFSTLRVSPFPPFYYILMNVWCGIFGFSEFSLRFPSMIFSTLSIVSIYFLAKIMFSEREGLIAALLLSVSSYSVNYSQDAKMYAMMWFFCILSFLYFFLYTNTQRKKYLVPYGIFSAITIYTMYLGFLFLLIQNILFLCLYRKNIQTWISVNALVLLCYIPWWNVAIYNMTHRSGIEWIKSKDYPQFFQKFFKYVSGVGIGDSVFWESWMLVILFVAALIFSIFVTIKGKQGSHVKNYLAVFAWPAVSVLTFIAIDKYFTNILVTRYLGFIHIPLVIIFAVGITAFDHLRLRWAGNLILIFMVFFALYYHVFPFHKHGLKIRREPWVELVNDLCEVADEKSLVLTNAIGCDMAIRYYGKCYKGEVTVLPPWRKVEEFIKGDDFDERKYDSIFILYYGRKIIRSDWVRKHRKNVSIKGYFGLIQITYKQ